MKKYCWLGIFGLVLCGILYFAGVEGRIRAVSDCALALDAPHSFKDYGAFTKWCQNMQGKCSDEDFGNLLIAIDGIGKSLRFTDYHYDDQSNITLNLVNGRSMREIIIIGNLLMLEAEQIEEIEAQRIIEKAERVEGSADVTAARIRFQEARGYQRMYKRNIEKYLVDPKGRQLIQKEPNKALEPTTTAVTPPAGQAARQP